VNACGPHLSNALTSVAKANKYMQRIISDFDNMKSSNKINNTAAHLECTGTCEPVTVSGTIKMKLF
jgi:hypothetical protein